MSVENQLINNEGVEGVANEVDSQRHDCEFGITNETREILRSVFAEFCRCPDLRVVHVTNNENMPVEGEVCVSIILLGDRDTGIYAHDKSSELHKGFVLVPKSDGWCVRMFRGDVYSQRNKKRRFIPRMKPKIGENPREDNDYQDLEVDDFEDLILGTTGGYNEVWVDVSKMSWLPVSMKFSEGETLQIYYDE